MITLYYWPTPNGHKITIFLEEAAVPYEIAPVNIRRGDQFKPEYLAISPNNRMPAIVDHAPADGLGPISVFESAAILQYLAEKVGKFLPSTTRGRVEVSEWLAWQVAGVGPMFGQAGHFRNYTEEKITYAVERYTNEVNRLYGVLERRLEHREWVCDAYSIADMAIFPWVKAPDRFGQDINDTPHVKRWIQTMQARPAVIRAYAKGEALSSAPADDNGPNVMFGQTAKTVRERSASAEPR